ncbi:hypothetical protein GCM10009678_45310 [Actinomadura kijaniata]|uniref:Uncharacterized protein n=1 Tax=Actinomadura namibiensis TaxID=182080 RepID=A0A7W3QJU4_ACTNM|nr:hypothetical protein [Actinomadura namibiensis]MBA8949814.1 hypothetical protein [Actinomadura namibiensis]
MERDTVERLRAEASRGDYASMARLARALYESGLGPREVVRECYGVDFPEELFVLVDAGPWPPDLLAYFTDQPWQLAVPPELGGPLDGYEELVETELLLLARDPDLVPLFRIPSPTPGRDDRVICYRLDDLRAGRSTVYGLATGSHPGEVRDAAAVRCGESMLQVLRDAHLGHLHALEEEARWPGDRGAGSVHPSEIEGTRECVELLRDLIREVDGRR